MSEDDELAALRDETAHGDRIDTADAASDRRAFVDDIVSELEAIDDGDKQKTVSVWDGHLAAFVRALEANPDRMTSVGEGLQQRLDLEHEEVDRSELLRLALRLGFKEAAPDELDAVRDAAGEHATNRL
ncbi:hypothetical protein [Halorubrum sp. Ea8]|uniref:hypothetical protein n=1 Tax=Halorubrum sp. Ea8 TaxID=1383841 RepID=UPI000B99C763|nr:hypothetical protein [Halorubrum sp. Ea8]OYR48281.1 hypothetical protein DJ74_10945 [Halorubrum sp. Ea8]